MDSVYLAVYLAVTLRIVMRNGVKRDRLGVRVVVLDEGMLGTSSSFLNAR